LIKEKLKITFSNLESIVGFSKPKNHFGFSYENEESKQNCRFSDFELNKMQPKVRPRQPSWTS